ncbi:hypothetical protein K488DRAFT_82238 [Vararia minispora EC-137]|uniref:Uncharacterized protein n=1 Tax=Vararia minispora EC-137 TaxID=1314806 RepID=A0ACB8QYF4_9AGAM|nr:hypothetical protein K488DRAFT_82238 [Vararia minispora EC-137]
MMLSSLGASGTLAALFFCASSVRATVTDYVIVGGGTGGLALANRLTENPRVSVLVLEAGGDGLGNVNISDLALVGASWGTDVDWQFPTETLPVPPGRNIGKVPRGKVLGGSSAINGAVYTRGDTRDFVQWAALGNPSWGPTDFFAASFKNEEFFPPPKNWSIDYIYSDHGHNGLLPTSFGNPAPPIQDAIINSVVAYGGRHSLDNEGGHPDGVAWATHARLPSNATRATSATGYYFPFSYRKNFQVKLFSQATRIIWKSTRGTPVAAGVEYVDQNGNTQVANATTVVLCGGVWGSPPILERSGVGNKTLLASLGIKSVVDLPGVGENMVEQTAAPMVYAFNTTLPLDSVTPLLLNGESLQETFTKGGDLAKLESLFVKPDNMAEPIFQAYQKLYQQGTTWVVGLTNLIQQPGQPTLLAWFGGVARPLSSGSCHITSSDGLAYPAVQYNWFTSEFDIYAASVTLQRIHNFTTVPPLSDWISARIAPPPNVTSLDDIGTYFIENCVQGDHPIGTAAMIPRQDGGVVDNNLKVYGTANVYVVDASVMPFQPTGYPHAHVYAIAERAAELFKAQKHY